MKRKIAICTTFPNSYYNLCAAEMLASIKNNWPEDIKLFIQVDPQPDDSYMALNNAIHDIFNDENRILISREWEPEQTEFVERWKHHQPESYMHDVIRFSHKVFALEKCADAAKDDIDVLIWLDADVITKRPVTYEWLEEVLPNDNEVCSYLGRPQVGYSECGWVAYNLQNGGVELLELMRQSYLNDTFKENEKGWTDCHVFDDSRGELPVKNLSEDIPGTNVWPLSPLGQTMEHRKGNRKHKQENLPVTQQKQPLQVVDSGNLQVKTKNCLDHEKICSNVETNLRQIRSWATLVRPSTLPGFEKAQDVVIVSAGPSVVHDMDAIKKHRDSGDLIIAVKHAIDPLTAHGIKPWAVVLLDPRAHVEGFIADPDPDVVYFVASMCDPSVVETLNKHKCKVIGYHALVNAGETSAMIAGDLPVAGGSATSTRSIALFADMFGFKNFHLYGYDLCHWTRPDMTEINQDGNPKYLEVNIGTHTHGNQYVTRTFWTEGQFLAQSNELQNLYKDRKDLTIKVYGNGLAGWLYNHWVSHTEYMEKYNAKLADKREGTPTLDEFVNAVTRGIDLARGRVA